MVRSSRCASGFKGTALAALEILDSFGQRSMLQLHRAASTTSSWPEDTFRFTPPKGVDVIQQ